jgi:hemerythrin
MIKSSELIWQDKQHQRLFELIDQINGEQVDVEVFKALHDYAEQHFLLEEEYMLRLDMPDRQVHIDAHNKFRYELANMLANYRDYDAPFREALTTFLSEWLKGHIFGIDKELEAFILDSDYK